MIQAYCKTCEAYTPFTLDHLRTWPSSRANARDMICPHCYSIITTLMADDEEGGYAFTYMAALADSLPPTSETEEPLPTDKKQANRTTRYLKLVP